MTAILYQLTASAAQMCLPVPVPAAAPDNLLDLLDHWQTLIGATTGGLLGVAGAWIVAISVRSRERRMAAGMVRPDLRELVARGADLEKSGDQIGWPLSFDDAQVADARAGHVLTQLINTRPNLFALQTPTIGQLSDIDTRVSSHLFQCQMLHRALEDGISTRQALQDAMSRARIDEPVRFYRMTTPDSQLYAKWRMCVEHATLAGYFLDRLVFSPWPRWMHRCRMRLWRNDLDRRSAALLKTGRLPADVPVADPDSAPAGRI
ncbi:hypothetical protein Bsp3421_000136 (plasmid) [Burkholderia sp. FERM BP-3421]|uniref:hypothetical protein n=1 Tax=Burkholderia sp. FERM BP-3421 TaxID=1494466 RepID=UPI0023626FAA|nr:hypothetical protein [Burkholderia sp. FERM BP-3421]WDD90311.1 hypothetical protein Bsp3421_000136 [Burkholderia sp. FERM BP-3421]